MEKNAIAQKTADEAVGVTVNHLMFVNRVTRKALGEALGISGPAMGRKIRGEIGWSLQDLYTVANFFNKDVAQLLPRQIPPETPKSLSIEIERDSRDLVAGAGFEPTTSGL